MDQERYQKLQQLSALGIKAYPANFLHKEMSNIVLEKAEKTQLRSVEEIRQGVQNPVRLAGRMMTFRSHGKLAFAHLQDFAGRIQISFVKDFSIVKGLNTEKMPDWSFIEKMLDLGDYIGVEGEMFLTNHGTPTLLVKELSFLGKTLRPLPEKFHGIADEEQILRQRYLDTLMNQSSRERFVLRSNIIRSIREFLWQNNFLEVETPILEHGATGAAARPYYTHNNGLDIDLVLRISQELPLKKIILGGFERVFEIGKAFRNEGIDPSHLPEHTHFEWYAAYWSFLENMDFIEQMIKYAIKSNNLNPIIPIKDKDGNVRDVDFMKEWERVDYVDLIKKDTGIDIMQITELEPLKAEIAKLGIIIQDIDNMSYPTLVDNLYKKVSRPHLVGPLFLYNYPKKMQPLARVNDENCEMVDQFQLVVNGWELSKGYSELVDPIDQAERFREQEADAAAGDEEAMRGDNEYIVAMEHGMPPISGVGLGLDRFVTLISGQDNLRDCVFFPLMRPKY
ncbi:MAG TPA: lysine--tRNA ligase [Candidatus Gracilibacteria bacterium]|nr:lysine--tRNA ligase [Candidatus Gracilibacteria bacterium]